MADKTIIDRLDKMELDINSILEMFKTRIDKNAQRMERYKSKDI